MRLPTGSVFRLVPSSVTAKTYTGNSASPIATRPLPKPGCWAFKNVNYLRISHGDCTASPQPHRPRDRPPRQSMADQLPARRSTHPRRLVWTPRRRHEPKRHINAPIFAASDLCHPLIGTSPSWWVSMFMTRPNVGQRGICVIYSAKNYLIPMKRSSRWGTTSLTSITGDSPTLLHLFGDLGQERFDSHGKSLSKLLAMAYTASALRGGLKVWVSTRSLRHLRLHGKMPMWNE